MKFHKNILKLDVVSEVDRLETWLRQTVRGQLHRRGVVVGISGGVDSATVLKLCVRAFGQRAVVAIMMPDQDSSPDSERLARVLAAQCGVAPLLENITAALEGLGCYARRDAAIRRVFPDYDAVAGWRAKIVLPPNLLGEETLNVFRVTVLSPEGVEETRPLATADFLQIVAASNFKQRVRMAMLYHHAELHHFAVIGTANKNERDQGFFVKHGDSGVDCDLLAHLYKTQIYQLAEHLEVPLEIRRRTPTSDTYSAPCSQEEFFFRLPFATMDLLWFAQEHSIPVAETARVMDLTEAQVQRAYDDFERKHRTTEALRLAPLRLHAAPINAG